MLGRRRRRGRHGPPAVDPRGDPSTGYNTAALASWQTSLASSGAALVNLLVVGDSVSEGYWADTTEAGRETLGYVGLLRAAFQTDRGGSGLGLRCTFRATGGEYTLGSDWTFAGSWLQQAQGPDSRSSAATGAANTATITVDGDTLALGYNVYTYTGDFAVSVDGGADILVTATAQPTLQARIVDIPLGVAGTHTVVVKGSAVAGKYAEIWGAAPRTGTTGVLVHNAAKNGEKAGMNGSDAGDRLWYVPLAPALTLVAFSLNDYAAQTALATYQTQVQALITAAQATGPVLLIGGNARGDDLTRPIPQSDYHAVLKGLADSANCAFIDFLAAWGDSATAVAAGLVNADKIHPTAAGHTAMKNAIYPLIQAGA